MKISDKTKNFSLNFMLEKVDLVWTGTEFLYLRDKPFNIMAV